MKNCSMSSSPWRTSGSPLRYSATSSSGSSSSHCAGGMSLQHQVLLELQADGVALRVVGDGGHGERMRREPLIRLECLTSVKVDVGGGFDYHFTQLLSGTRRPSWAPSNLKSPLPTLQAHSDRRLSAGHRCPQAQRHRHDLRPAGHSDHRPHPQGAGRGPARAFVPPRAERRLRRLDRRLPHAEARHLPDGVRARLPQRPQRARPRDRQLLPDDPHQRLERARDRRPAAGRLRGDGPARHRQAGRQGRLPRAARRGHRRRHRARHPRRRLRPPGRRLPRPAGQAVRAEHRRGGRQEFADQGGRSGAEADSRRRTP